MSAMHIEQIKIGERVRKDMGDITGLAESMKSFGQLCPILITPTRELIDGERRVIAAKFLGWQEIAFVEYERETRLEAQRDSNAQRKNWLPSEAVAIGKQIEEQERPEAIERKRAGQDRGRVSQHGENVDNADSTLSKRVRRPEVAEIAARTVGMGRGKYKQAKDILAAAEADPERFGDLPAKMDETGNVHGTHRELERRQGKKQKKKMPLNKAGKNPERIAQAQLRAGIWQQVKDSLTNLSTLPDASEVATMTRAQARDKGFIDKKLPPALKWLKEFSHAWSNHREGK